METVERYLQVFEDLKRKKRWSTDTNVLRFAALTLAASEIDDPGGRLETAADELRRRSGAFGKLNSPIRYVVAAMILRKGLRPGAVYDKVGEVQGEFRERKYRRGGVAEVLAALLLVLQNGGRRPRKITLDRVGAILERCGFDVLRGGTSSRASRRTPIFDDLVARIANRPGAITAVTPDGSRGPAGAVQPGIALLACRTGAELYCLKIHARPALYLPTWDRTMIPLSCVKKMTKLN